MATFRWPDELGAGGALSRRALVVRAGALVGAGVLAAACGQAAGGGERIAQGSTTREVTIRWSTWGDDKNTFNTDAAPKGVALFNQKFPKIHISIEPQIGDWTTKNQTEWIAGSGPDISGHCCQWGPQWARDGLLVNLDPYMKRDFPQKVRDDFVSWLMDLFHDQEHGQFALPMYSGTIGLYYNKVLFQKKGVPFPDDTWDWNKYREMSIKLNDPQNGVYGRRQIRGYDRILQRLHQAGAHYVDPKDDRKAVFDTPEALQALQYERDANLKDKYTAREGDFNATQGMDLWKAISAQKFAMWEEGSWVLVRQTTQVEKDVVPQWDVAPLPKGPKQRDTLATNDGWSIWKGSKAIDEAWEFLKFLESDEWNNINARISGQQPARKSFQDTWEKLIKEANPLLADKNLKPFTDAIKQNYARPIELFRKHKESNDIVNDLFNRAVYSTETSSSIKNGADALDAAVKDAVQRINELNKQA
jgi:multiple sugar transport system substrate-binding protein